MRISYTPESIVDLMRLREFIEVKNPLAAQRVATSKLHNKATVPNNNCFEVCSLKLSILISYEQKSEGMRKCLFTKNFFGLTGF